MLGQCLICECETRDDCIWVVDEALEDCEDCYVEHSSTYTGMPLDSTCVMIGDEECDNNNDCYFPEYDLQLECVEDEFEEGSYCTSDTDEDGIYDLNDFCTFIIDEGDVGDQLDSDDDCFDFDGSRSSLFGECGDVCDLEGALCYDPYSEEDRECCDDYGEGTVGEGESYGVFDDCPFFEVAEPIGCWSMCVTSLDDNECVDYCDSGACSVTYETSSCVDSIRHVTEIITCDVDDSEHRGESREQACQGLPLIPFFTNFNILMTLLILGLFYRRRF